MNKSLTAKAGVLVLQLKENEFLNGGVQLLVDGHDPDVVKQLLNKEVTQTVERHARGASIFEALGDVSPAMGMVGTLIGLVAMLSNMDDPKSIGPAMAVALLTTLYGAMLANIIAIPVADKLKLRQKEEQNNRKLIIDALLFHGLKRSHRMLRVL